MRTGDVKHQWEKKDGDKVRGHYSMLEADGSVRIVDYTADSKTGFSATVKHKGVSQHPISSKASSHSEFELKPQEKDVGHFPDAGYTLLKAIDDSKSSVTQYDDYEKYKHSADVDTEHKEENYEYKYVYPSNDHQVDYGAGQEYETKIPSHQDVATDDSKHLNRYAKQEAEHKLPVDVNLVKSIPNEKIIPTAVSVLKPVEIDLTDSVDPRNRYGDNSFRASSERSPHFVPTLVSEHRQTQHQTSKSQYTELTDGDYQNFLKHYYKTEKVNESQQLNEEEYQKFLQDYYKPKNGQVLAGNGRGTQKTFNAVDQNGEGGAVRTSAQNTFRSNKKPPMTPGLRNFGNGRRKPVRYQGEVQGGGVDGGKSGPVLFPVKRQGGLVPVGNRRVNTQKRYSARI